MSINKISIYDLCEMQGKEGLVLQGCGGEPQEWLDGINELLTEQEILRNGSKFESCSVFENGGLTCILYPFDKVDINVGKLALWRIGTHDIYGGTWLTDYVNNELGGFYDDKIDEDIADDSDEKIEFGQ